VAGGAVAPQERCRDGEESEASDYLTDDERLAGRLAERPAARAARVAAKAVDPAAAVALRRLWAPTADEVFARLDRMH